MNVVSTLVLCLTVTALLYKTELIMDQKQYEDWASFHLVPTPTPGGPTTGGGTAGGGTRRL